jgi:hypothetical protein
MVSERQQQIWIAFAQILREDYIWESLPPLCSSPPPVWKPEDSNKTYLFVYMGV